MSKPPYDASRPIKPLRLKSTEEQHIEVLEAKVERLTEHIRERERVWSERERVAIKEAKRLNEALAKYEADDVRYLKDRAAWDAEAAELRAQAERLTNKLNTDSQSFQIECQKAEIEVLRAKVERLRADPRLTLTADDLYVILSWCPVGNETAGRVRRVADALEEE